MYPRNDYDDLILGFEQLTKSDNASQYDDLIPGLERLATSDDVGLSCEYHNTLLPDNTLSDVGVHDLDEHRERLRQLFKRFNAHDKFGVNTLHSHFHVPDGYHLAGDLGDFEEHRYYLTQGAVNETFNPKGSCGRKFKFVLGQGLRPYEFHRGPLPDLSKVDSEFFSQFTNYLVEHSLTSTLGLEYIVPELLLVDMLEFILPNGGMLLAEATSPCSNDHTVTTGLGWPSDLTGERKIECVPQPDGGHEQMDIKPKEILRIFYMVDQTPH
ncbi:hypothetical protein FALBO_16622 [Fusarium albosuccineum]|uniref:Uncharacterized protein n=1 Tax=Fusarium albosuccineum TaxID=1237068 RepID=A0A8H4NSJ8_9HYPO|nr:hypothetical protein FALBO_16622 [Fusarium albosuccineum]